MVKIQGYLVVLVEPDYKSKLNNSYEGIDRLPPYPSLFEQEQEAMELYVFGDYKNEYNVITSLDKAMDLKQQFSESPRKFEILFSRNHTFGQPLSSNHVFIGYDVAGIGDFWSIVGDYPPHPQIKKYLTSFNRFGLFKEPSVAIEFLHEYKNLKLADYDINFHVFEMFKVV